MTGWGVFTYSPEEDTPAAEMPDQIPEEIKEERQAELMELQQDIAFDAAEDMIGKEVLVMVEGKVADENAYVGRTYKDAPGCGRPDLYQYRRRTDVRRFCKSESNRSIRI